jgi:SAM-dependent methyltransferase
MGNGKDISIQGLPVDKAGEHYWTEFWRGKRLPPPIRLAAPGPRAWFHQEFHNFWRGYLPPASKAPIRLLEIGCAQSRWLPYFAREWGYQVAGLDYSELGCLQSRALLAREGLAGEIFHQDMFCPEPRQVAGFDLVFSNGVAEHFEDTAAVLRQMGVYLRPGGLLLTIIPNLVGWLGWLQGKMSPEVMATHRPLTREELNQAHEDAGLRPLCCAYLALGHCSVANPGTGWPKWSKLLIFKTLKGASVLAGALRRLYPGLPLDRRTAGYIVCLAEKPFSKENTLSDWKNFF